MKKFTLTFRLLITLVSLGVSFIAKSQDVYWREGFEGGTISTTNPTSGGPVGYYAQGANSPGSWYMAGTYRTTGNACAAPYGPNHIRFRNGAVALPDSPALVTPIVDFGISTIHFTRTRANLTGGFSFFITTDTAALTQNWTLVGYAPPSPNICVDTAISVVGNPLTASLAAAAKRVRILGRQSTDNDMDSIWLVSATPILPVKFTAINALETSGKVKLTWGIGVEANVSRYVVERSSNGISFSEVGSLAATQSSSYNWVDNIPSAGNNFYRIKSIDKDGSSLYTSIVRVALGSKLTELVIAPNPIRSHTLNLQLSNFDKGVYSINVFNGQGQKVFSSSINHTGGSATQSFQLPANIKAGMYSLQLANGLTVINRSLIVE
jgi:hypothetical protein